ncbi:MAG TPA: hypothetical protein VFW25_16025 [Silvibacterium sp.]|nr:hypothetical protein [Silvibacterium sp.]
MRSLPQRYLSWMFVSFSFILFSAAHAWAQTGVYAEFSGSNIEVPNVGWQYGPTFGLYHDAWHFPFVRVGLDARATLLSSSTATVDMGFIGPRLQIHPHVLPFMPYVEGLVGAGKVDLGGGTATIKQTALAYEGVAGVDWTILPHVDWRVAEFSIGGFSGVIDNPSPRTLSTGIVVRLP